MTKNLPTNVQEWLNEQPSYITLGEIAEIAYSNDTAWSHLPDGLKWIRMNFTAFATEWTKADSIYILHIEDRKNFENVLHAYRTQEEAWEHVKADAMEFHKYDVESDTADQQKYHFLHLPDKETYYTIESSTLA